MMKILGGSNGGFVFEVLLSLLRKRYCAAAAAAAPSGHSHGNHCNHVSHFEFSSDHPPLQMLLSALSFL